MMTTCEACRASVPYCAEYSGRLLCPSCLESERLEDENIQLKQRIAELEAELADANSLIEYAELNIDEAVEDGWEPPSGK